LPSTIVICRLTGRSTFRDHVAGLEADAATDPGKQSAHAYVDVT